MSRASTKLRYWSFIKFYFLDWPPRQPMSTGRRPRTLVTTWATTRPGQYTTDRISNVYICSGNSNGSTPPARTTTRSPLTGLPVGSPSTTGQHKKLPSHILMCHILRKKNVRKLPHSMFYDIVNIYMIFLLKLVFVKTCFFA